MQQRGGSIEVEVLGEEVTNLSIDREVGQIVGEPGEVQVHYRMVLVCFTRLLHETPQEGVARV